MSFDLTRALEDLAEAGAARRSADGDALAVRIGAMASRIRRRRALRHAGTTVVAACAVGALGLGVAFLPGLLDGPTGPAAPPAPPAPSEPPAPLPSSTPPGTTLEPFDAARACGDTLGALEQRGQLAHYSETRERTGPGTDDLGWSEVVGLVPNPAGPGAVEVEHRPPSGAELSEISWMMLVLDGDDVVGSVVAELTATHPGPDLAQTTIGLPLFSCATGEPLVGAFDVAVVVEAHGTRAGTPYVERTTTDLFPVDLELELGSTDPASPVTEVFACGQPGPESIHALPDPAGLTLAVDLPEGPWDPAQEITATVGASDGRSIIANVSQGASFALVDDSGTVVGFLGADAPDIVELVEVGPQRTATMSTTTYLTTCGPTGVATPPADEAELEGTFTA